jgi:hypothetical protein
MKTNVKNEVHKDDSKPITPRKNSMHVWFCFEWKLECNTSHKQGWEKLKLIKSKEIKMKKLKTKKS